MKKSTARAEWLGTIKEGKGTAQIPSIGKEVSYSFGTRFENEKGTDPEELIAAAHSQCFSMAFSLLLTENGFNPEKISTSADVTIGKKGEGHAILSSHLTCEARVEGIDKAKFEELAGMAKENCPVSKALAGVEISLEANLV